MTFEDEFEKNIRERNIKNIRNNLIAVYQSCPSFSDGDFVKYLNYANKKLGKEIFDPYTKKFEMVFDETRWNENYASHLGCAVEDEFSEELVKHLIQVGKYVYGNKNDEKNRGQDLDRSEQASGYPKSTWKIGVCIVIVVMVIIVLKCISIF